MSKLYCDGVRGDHATGRYALISQEGAVIEHKQFVEPCRSTRDAGVLALLRAVELATDEQVIYSSSIAGVKCLRKGRGTKHPDVNTALARAKKLAQKKRLRFQHVDPEKNLAKLYNEQCGATSTETMSVLNSAELGSCEPARVAASTNGKIVRRRMRRDHPSLTLRPSPF